MATFTRVSPGTENPETGIFTGPATTSWSGAAIQVNGSANEYARFRAAGLVEDKALVLGWTPSTYVEGSLPALGATIVWASETYTLAVILKVVAPDGVPIYARLGCIR